MLLNDCDIVKHERFLDIALIVLKYVELENNDILLAGYWVNQGFTKTIIYKEKIKLIINKNILEQDWLVCLDSELTCIRYADWKYIGKK